MRRFWLAWLAWLGALPKGTLDRRWLYLCVAGLMVLPLLYPWSIPPGPVARVNAFASALEELPPGSTVLISADYDPGSAPELQPVLVAVLRVAMQRQLHILATSLQSQGPLLVQRAWGAVSAELAQGAGGQAAADMLGGFVNLGFREGGILVPAQLGTSFAATFGEQWHEQAAANPWMRQVHRLADVSLLISLSSGSPGAVEWVAQSQGRFVDKMIVASTSMQATELLPFLQSGQISGLVAGVMDAARLEERWLMHGRALASMASQSVLHIFLVAAILLASIRRYFVSGERP